jgi:predicted Fe-Mo cluster-binding NifX family protein
MHHSHGQCTPADLFSANGIEAVLCNGIGAGAVARLHALGITVYINSKARTFKEAIESFEKETLEKVNIHHACQGHNCH